MILPFAAEGPRDERHGIKKGQPDNCRLYVNDVTITINYVMFFLF